MGRRWVRVFLAVAAIAILIGTPARASSKVVQINLEGVVDPFVASFVERSIDEASNQGAAAVLITIDTPGGLDSSMRKIVKAVLGSDVPVICFVSPQGARAASAGTFILLACPVAAMAPGTNVGAAHPVGISGAIEQDKVTNDAVAYIRSLAEQRGRNAEWAEKAVRDSDSISAEEALKIEVIDQVAPSVDELLEKLDGTSVNVVGDQSVALDTDDWEVTPAEEMGLATRILHALLEPGIAFALFYLGLILIVVELLHPGVSVPGILGAISILASFAAFGMLPIQLVGIVLLIASAVFFLLELKLPGIGFPTVGGVASLVSGGLLLFDPRVPGARLSGWVIAPVAIAAALFFYFVVRAALRARAIPVDYRPATLVGAEGIAVTNLNPVGSARVALEDWTAESVGGRIPKGTKIRVVATEGLKLKVEAVESRPSEVAAQAMERGT